MDFWHIIKNNRAIYSLLEQTLYDLEIVKDPKPLIKKFEQEILILLGFWPREQSVFGRF